MRHDICAVTLGERRILSFMTVALGLMADLDLGESYRLLSCCIFLIPTQARSISDGLVTAASCMVSFVVVSYIRLSSKRR